MNSSKVNISSLYLHLGVPRFKRALPPAYLDIQGYDECLENHSPPGATHTEYCLPATKPDDCTELSWDKIKNSFDKLCHLLILCMLCHIFYNSLY